MTPLGEATERARFGGKAVQLGAALRAWLPVPAGFALHADLAEAIAAGKPDALATLADVRARLRGPLAVRSSAVGEDAVEASFAGQHVTRLGVCSVDDLRDAVQAVVDSARSPAAYGYRRRLGVPDTPRVGVVVQEVVDADRAGVLFTRHPLTGDDECVVEASWGLGEAVVAGVVVPDLYRVARGGRVLERTAGAKPVAIRLATGGGTVQEAVPPARAEELCLTDVDLERLAELANRCEQVFTGALDIEWAFRDGALWLLQSRPITTRPG